MKFTERDKRILLILGAFLACVAVYLLGSWALGSGGSGSLASRQAALGEIIQQYRTFQKTQDAFNNAEADMKRAGDFELLSELDDLAQKAGVKENLVSIDKKSQPKNPYYEEEAVEVKLDKVTIVQLMSYLYELEYSPKVLRVKELHVEVRYDNKDQMNVRMLVSKFAPLKNQAAPAAPSAAAPAVKGAAS